MKWTNLNRKEVEKFAYYLNLTDEEEVIFYSLTKGRSIQEIADQLGLSTRTVDRRIQHIKNKMNVVNRSET